MGTRFSAPCFTGCGIQSSLGGELAGAQAIVAIATEPGTTDASAAWPQLSSLLSTIVFYFGAAAWQQHYAERHDMWHSAGTAENKCMAKTIAST